LKKTQGCSLVDFKDEDTSVFEKLHNENSDNSKEKAELIEINKKESTFNISNGSQDKYHFVEEINEEEPLSIHDKELELIIKALERNQGKRKAAAIELGISERTLYRKIKQHDIEL
jgi:transcriptional regulator of acetoin/glycerol metabolism